MLILASFTADWRRKMIQCSMNEKAAIRVDYYYGYNHYPLMVNIINH